MTHTDYTWGPWIEHDGKGCPCLGEFVQTEMEGTDENFVGIAGSEGGRSWDMTYEPLHFQILRYRIRKPRGMAVLDAVMADLTAPIVEGVE